MSELNKVILLGGNHHNGLGLARIFGVNGIKPYGIIIGKDSDRKFICKSKYWEQTWAVANETEAIALLLEKFGNESLKPVLISWSDGASSAIDLNLNRLKENFIVPSLNGVQGAVDSLMDKYKQIEFAHKYGLPMAKSWIVNFEEGELPSDITFPCILKPVASYEGNKYDIRKCNSLQEAQAYCDVLQGKGYRRILIQEYLKFEKEITFDGCCGKTKSYLISENIREWPVIGGTNSFFGIYSTPEVEQVCKNIWNALKLENYSGMFDIELFLVNGKIYLNEINWRNTGNSFFSLGTGVYYALIWYYDVIGKEHSLKCFCDDKTQFAMDESADLRHVVYCGLPMRKWMKDRAKTQSFALWFKGDLKPTMYQYCHLVAEIFRRGKNYAGTTP